MKNGHGGVVIGSEISGGYRNLFVENCEMDSPELGRVIRIKTSTCREEVLLKMYLFAMLPLGSAVTVLRINLQYENRQNCQPGLLQLLATCTSKT